MDAKSGDAHDHPRMPSARIQIRRLLAEHGVRVHPAPLSKTDDFEADLQSPAGAAPSLSSILKEVRVRPFLFLLSGVLATQGQCFCNRQNVDGCRHEHTHLLRAACLA